MQTLNRLAKGLTAEFRVRYNQARRVDMEIVEHQISAPSREAVSFNGRFV
jgi:hypothetical protein